VANGQITFVTGATVPTGTFFYTPGGQAGTALAGATYKWVADADSLASTTPGWQEDFDVVTDTDYALADADSSINTNGNTSNLTRVARKSKVDGTVYITVSMKDATSIPGVEDFTDDNHLWFSKGNAAPDDDGELWSDMAIDLGAALVFAPSGKVLAIKSTSHSYRYYAGGSDILEGAPTAPVTTVDACIYLPSDTDELPVKWRVYGTGTFTATTAVNGILLRQLAPSKIITLEVTERSEFSDSSTQVNDVIAKIVIDYNGVTIATGEE
jgi:hypothetical protein